MEWLSSNWVNVVAIVGGVYTIASVVVRMTPTKSDDIMLARVKKKWDKFLAILDMIFASSRKKDVEQ